MAKRIDTSHGQNVATPSRFPLDTRVCTRQSGSSQLASDEALSRTACPGTELHGKPTRSAEQLREMCSSPAPCAQTQCSDDVRLNTVIGISEGGSQTDVTSERQRLHGEGGEDNDFRSRGTEASKKKAPPQTTVVYNIVYNSGAASNATIGSGTPAHREISTPPSPRISGDSSVASLCCNPP